MRRPTSFLCRSRLGYAALAIFGAVQLAIQAQTAAVTERPNIILCMADDHGWHEVGYYNHPYLKTAQGNLLKEYQRS